MPFTLDLSGRTALVTGGGQGVGRAIGLAFAAAGASVIVNDVVHARAAEVADEIVAAGGSAQPSAFDVSDAAAVHAAASELPAIDVLVNNAGNGGAPSDEQIGSGRGPSVSIGSFVDSQPADWQRFFGVNLYGVLNCTHAVLPAMVEQGHGRIVTIVSDAARWGEPRMAAYAAAKGGAAAFTRALAREVGGAGITVNNVALATIDTFGLGEAARESPELAARLDAQLRRYIIRRLGTPDDVAGLVTFLASDHASWITGQTYPVNGGYTVNQ
jgi:NAD(P)-dependent dehydrogenase (short-subunit alcohol dehydrogenase family)